MSKLHELVDLTEEVIQRAAQEDDVMTLVKLNNILDCLRKAVEHRSLNSEAHFHNNLCEARVIANC
jgi:hypothetical protein